MTDTMVSTSVEDRQLVREALESEAKILAAKIDVGNLSRVEEMEATMKSNKMRTLAAKFSF